MSKGKTSYIVERFCPVVGKNVVMKVYFSREDDKTVCLNDLRCADINGGCRNKLIKAMDEAL